MLQITNLFNTKICDTHLQGRIAAPRPSFQASGKVQCKIPFSAYPWIKLLARNLNGKFKTFQIVFSPNNNFHFQTFLWSFFCPISKIRETLQPPFYKRRICFSPRERLREFEQKFLICTCKLNSTKPSNAMIPEQNPKFPKVYIPILYRVFHPSYRHNQFQHP